MPRPKFLDPSSLTKAERLIAVGSWLGVVNAFVPWWFRAETAGGARTFTAGLSKAGTVAWLCFALAALLILGRSWIWPNPAPRRDGTLYALFGAGAAIALAVQGLRVGPLWIGFYVAILLAAVVFVGGMLRRNERRAGWR